MIECTLHMHVRDSDCPEFRDEILFKTFSHINVNSNSNIALETRFKW